VRTKWFDEYFIGRRPPNGIDQAVILAAGLDARRLAAAVGHGQRYLRDRPAAGIGVQG